MSRTARRRPTGPVPLLLALLLLAVVPAAWAQTGALAAAERLLYEGRASAAAGLLADGLTVDPDDAPARLALGAVQAMTALEALAQDAYRYGLGGGGIEEAGQMLGVAVPRNPQPEPVGYDDLRATLERFHAGLATADATLAPLTELIGTEAGRSLQWRVELGRVRLDFDGDGVAGEPLSQLLAQARRVRPAEPGGAAGAIPIDADLGDALWLRGYLNLIAATLDAVLAYDAREAWDATAQLFFPRAVTAIPYLAEPSEPRLGGFDAALLADVIALIHLIDLPVVDADRAATALTRLRTTVAMSQASWRAILAETDDGREWLPNPRQSGVVPGGPDGDPLAVEEAMVTSWLELMDELDAILAGERLVPYWRVTDGRGVNVRRVFLEPRALDLILWIQGAAVQPYLETGTVTSPDDWARIRRAFGGRFATFAFWFN